MTTVNSGFQQSSGTDFTPSGPPMSDQVHGVGKCPKASCFTPGEAFFMIAATEQRGAGMVGCRQPKAASSKGAAKVPYMVVLTDTRQVLLVFETDGERKICLLYTSPSPRD